MQRHVHQSRIILAGDFNLADIDWSTMHHASEASEVLIDLMLNFNLHQLVTRPTRVQGSTKNILDLIFLSNHFTTSQAQIDIIEGISDHSIPMCTFQLDHCITTQSTLKSFFNFHKADDASILTYLSHEFDSFSEKASQESTDVDALWLHFKSIVLHCITNYIPMQKKNSTLRIHGSHAKSSMLNGAQIGFVRQTRITQNHLQP